MQKVVIVASGGWGDLKPQDYRQFIEEHLKADLEEANKKYDQMKIENLKFSVEEAETSEEAVKRLAGSHNGFLVYVTRSKELEAEKVAKENPHLKVIVFTGLIPDGKVRYVNKGWLSRSNADKFFC